MGLVFGVGVGWDGWDAACEVGSQFTTQMRCSILALFSLLLASSVYFTIIPAFACC